MPVESCNSPTIIGFGGGFAHYRIYPRVNGKSLVEYFLSSCDEDGQPYVDWSSPNCSESFDTESDAWRYVGEQIGWVEKEETSYAKAS